jgi:Fe-S cluster biogenesis protein NfuA
MSVDRDAQESGERIEQLLDELRTTAPAATVERVEELVGRVVGLYGAGLARIVTALCGPAGSLDGARNMLVSDPMVSSLLVLHGLHPEDVRSRVERGLAGARPYVESHGGKLALVAIEDDVVKLRLDGTCETCPSSGETATQLLDRAVRDAAPEIARVEVDTGPLPKTGISPKTGSSPKVDASLRAGGPPSPSASPAAVGLVQLRRSKADEPASAPPPDAAPAPEAARCEMCSAEIGEAHDHVARVASRELLCVCRPCWLLFEHEGAGRGNYRPVSNRWAGGAWLELSDLAWAALGIPVRMAFFVVDSTRGPLGIYPSPGGPVEASIDDDAWRDLRQKSRALDAIKPDVEAWLVDGRDREGFAGYIVPIDACYELVGQVRLQWRGFDGGDAARAIIDAFFENVRSKTVTPSTRDTREPLQVQP